MRTPPLPLCSGPWLACALLVAASASAAGTGSGAVRLASASASGSPAQGGGQVCATSADGQQVLFTSIAANLVPGDIAQDDLFLKNLATGAVAQVNTDAAGARVVNRTALVCHAMSSDGTWVAFTASTGGSNPYLPGPEVEATLMLKNTRTGELLRVSPPRSSLPTCIGFSFGSMTPDGSRIAFIAQPTTTDLGGYVTVANGPARPLVFDRATRQVLDLSATVLLDAGPELSTVAENRLVLSPDGRTLAYDARRDQPAAGDADGLASLLQAQVDGGTVQRLNLAGLAGASARPLRYTADAQRLVFEVDYDSPLGVAGLYAATLATGGTRLLAPRGIGIAQAFAYRVDDTAARAAFLRYDPATQQRTYAFVRDTASGQEQRLDVSAAGKNGNGSVYALELAAGGAHAAFTSSSTNLLSLPRGTSGAQVYTKALP